MMPDIQKLQKIEDILNSEGTILGLHKYKADFFLSSHLSDGSGTVYYSADVPALKKYFNGEIKLRELYMASDDLVVPCRSNNKVVYCNKQGLADRIACGDRLFPENAEGVRSDRIAKLFNK